MGDADAGACERRHVVGREVDAVGAPDVVRRPAELGEVFDRRAPVELTAVRLLVDGLSEVGMEAQPEAARELG